MPKSHFLERIIQFSEQTIYLFHKQTFGLISTHKHIPLLKQQQKAKRIHLNRVELFNSQRPKICLSE